MSPCLDTFVIDLKKKVSKAFPDQPHDDLLLNHFIAALPAEYRSAVVAAGCEKFDEAVTKVRNLNAIRDTPVRSVAIVDRQLDVLPQLLARIGELERQLTSTSGSTGTLLLSLRHGKDSSQAHVPSQQSGRSAGGAQGVGDPPGIPEIVGNVVPTAI